MGPLSDSQLDFFAQEGWLLVEGLLNPGEDLDPIIAEYHQVLDTLADRLVAQGRIRETWDGLDFNERLIRIYRESDEVHAQHFDFSLPKSDVRPDTPLWVGPAVFRMLRNERLLDAVEQFIGPEIFSNPVQHVRLKPPERLTPRDEQGRIQLGITPWHQDHGVVTEEADDTDMLTVWFPLWDAPLEAGCLEVLPRSHRQGLHLHCPSHGGPRLTDEVIQRGVPLPLPMKRGDVLFLTRHTCHASLPNRSERVRWSFDLRYSPIGQPTGRGLFPGFVARSRANPASELHDPREWARMWHAARAAMVGLDTTGRFDRWDINHPAC